MVSRAAGAILLICVVLGCDGGHDATLEVTGQIESDAVTAGSKIGGRVEKVLVEEGGQVKKGDVLIRLDAAETQAALSAAQAQLAQAEALLLKAETGATAEQLAQAEAALKAAEEQYTLARKGAREEEKRAAQAGVEAARAPYDAAKADYDRAQRLLQQEVIPQQVFDRSEAAFKAAEAQLKAAREKADIVDEGLRAEEIAMAKANYDRAKAFLDEVKRGPRDEDLAAARATRDAAAAQVERAQVALREMEIVAPIDGLIESLDVRPGDLIKPGPIVRLMNPEDLDLTIYVSAAMLGHLQTGQKVVITTDAHGLEEFEGIITHIASEGEYTPRNLQTEEERVQQVFSVEIQLDSAGGKLRAGMTAIAHLPRAGAGQ